VEVVNQDGRAYVNWEKDNKVELSLQDDGKTLKVFISTRKSEPITDDIRMQALLLKSHKMKRETWIRNVMKVYPEMKQDEIERLCEKIFRARPPLDS
jgi:hypothetical protein